MPDLFDASRLVVAGALAALLMGSGGPAQCNEANMSCTVLHGVNTPSQYAVHFRSSARIRILGVTMRTRSSVGGRPSSGRIELWLTDARGRPLRSVASGTLQLGDAYRNYSGRFTSAYSIDAGTDYAVVFTLTNGRLPICLRGKRVTHWWRPRIGWPWQGPLLTSEWSIRVDCMPLPGGSYGPFGKGCKGSGAPTCNGGVPELSAKGVPTLGKTMQLQLRCARPRVAYLLLFGTSNTSWRGVRLPFDLGSLGAPGCNVLAAPDVVLDGRTDAAGQAVFPWTMPNDTRLLGARFYNQALVFDPGARGGLAASQGGAGRIGG